MKKDGSVTASMSKNIPLTSTLGSAQGWVAQNIPSTITVAELFVYVKDNRYYRKWYKI